MPKHLLIVSFVFPPSSGIGGRRWAKFSKSLFRKGYNIRIISNTIWKTEQSNWNHDVKDFEEKILRIPSGYPKYLNVFEQSFIDKILYRLSLFYVKIFSLGSFFDRSIFWKKNLQRAVEKHIEGGFNTVIVTCAPYRSALYLAQLKNQYPQMKLIVDLRDPWEMETTLYGFSTLSKKRQAFEMTAQDYVMRNADKVISVYEYMTRKYKDQYPDQADKFHTLGNGFDKDDFTNITAPTHSGNTERVKFLFAGSFYPGAQHILKDFIHSLDIIQKENPEIYDRLQFDFHGRKPDSFDEIVYPHSKIVNYGGMLVLKDVYQKIAEADFMMLFLLDEMTYSLSTKFYEYISQNKPVVVFAKGGEAGRFVENNKLGYFAEYGSIDEKLLELVHAWDKGVRFHPKQEIDTTKFDIEHLTEKLVEIIDK